MEIKAKIYYLISTGEVLTITSEMQGCVEETTKDQDVKYYPELQGKNASEIDFITLNYGTLASTFNNAKSYVVNLTTKQLEVVYYTADELAQLNATTTTV